MDLVAERAALGTEQGKEYFLTRYYEKESKRFVKEQVEWRIPDTREAICAEDQCSILSADYSQIEIKLMAFLSGDKWLTEAINSGKDIHCYFISDIYGSERDFDYDLAYVAYKSKGSHSRFEEITNLRNDTKCVAFGVPYGAGPPNIALRTRGDVSEESLKYAADIINRFFSKAYGLKEWLDRQGDDAIRYGFTTSPRGRKRFYTLPSMDDPEAEMILAQIRRWAGNHPIQCLEGSSRIFVEGHGYKPIRDFAGKQVRLWDGHQWSNARVVASGRKKLVKTELMGGHYIETSPDHKFSILTTRNTRAWKTAAELKSKNHRVELTDPVPDWELKGSLPPAPKSLSNNRKDKCLTSFISKKDLGEFLGRIASDGCVKHRTVTLLVAEHEKAILPRMEELAGKVGKFRTATVFKDGYENPIYHVTICSTSLAEQCRQIGIKERIPEFVWNSREMLRAYIRGVFDGDGGVEADGARTTWGKGRKHISWAREVQQALLLLGIRSRLSWYEDEGNGYRVNLCIQKYDMPVFCKEIGFINPKKDEKARKVTGNPRKGVAKYGRGVSPKTTTVTEEEVEMYDVIFSDTQQFMANGLVVHNSGNVDMLKPAMVMIYEGLREMKLSWKDARILFVVHDEIVMQVRNHLIEPVKQLMQTSMQRAYDLVIPNIINKIDVAIGQQWEKA
jgi:hypothetical protein